MTLAEAEKDLNSYYVQTNRYEFTRFDKTGKPYIKIVSLASCFSIVYRGYMIFYGELSECKYPDLKPYTLYLITHKDIHIGDSEAIIAVEKLESTIIEDNCSFKEVIEYTSRFGVAFDISWVKKINLYQDVLIYNLFSLLKMSSNKYAVISNVFINELDKPLNNSVSYLYRMPASKLFTLDDKKNIHKYLDTSYIMDEMVKIDSDKFLRYYRASIISDIESRI